MKRTASERTQNAEEQLDSQMMSYIQTIYTTNQTTNSTTSSANAQGDNTHQPATSARWALVCALDIANTNPFRPLECLRNIPTPDLSSERFKLSRLDSVTEEDEGEINSDYDEPIPPKMIPNIKKDDDFDDNDMEPPATGATAI